MSRPYPHEDSQSPELSQEEEEEGGGEEEEEEDGPQQVDDEDQNGEDEEEGEEDGGKCTFIAPTNPLPALLQCHKPRFVCPITPS